MKSVVSTIISAKKQEAYFHAVHRKSIEDMPSQKMIAFIVAISTALVLLDGCTDKHQNPLSNSQIDDSISHTQEYPTRQTQGGYTLELKSTTTESNTAFATFRLTAPEEVDLSNVLDIHTEERLSFPGLLATPRGSKLPADLSYKTLDDGDGRNNTLDIVLRITPITSHKSDSASGSEKSCVIVFRDIVKWGYDREYEQELLSTKYAGQTGYLLDPEESKRLHPQMLLVSGNWYFEIEWNEANTSELELLESPISTKVLVVRSGTEEYETVDSMEDVTLSSIRIRPPFIEVSFEHPEPYDTFECVYLDAAMFMPAAGTDFNNIILVLKDGTKVELFQEDRAKGTAVLRMDRPIVLSEVDYLQMSDGTMINADYPIPNTMLVSK